MQKDYDVEVEWKAFELHPEFPPGGKVLDGEPTPHMKQVGETMRQMAEEAGLPYVRSSKIPNSRLALEAAEFARANGKFDEYHKALFTAYFGEGRNIGDRAVLSELAEQVGLMPDELDKALRNCTFSKVVQQEVDGAHAVGITAVPTFVIGNRGIVGVQSYDVFKFVMSSLDKE